MRSPSPAPLPAVLGMFLTGALLGSCSVGDALRSPTPDERFHNGLAAAGDLGAISGIRTTRVWGWLERPGSEERVRYDEVRLVPVRSVIRIEASDAIWIGVSDEHGRRWFRSPGPGEPLQQEDPSSPGPLLGGVPVWSLRIGGETVHLGRVGLPGWFRLTEGIPESHLRAAGRGEDGERLVSLEVPPVVEGTPASTAEVAFDRHSGRVTGYLRRFEVGGEEHSIRVRFADWSDREGFSLPTRQTYELEDGVRLVQIAEGFRVNDSNWPSWLRALDRIRAASPFPWYEHEPEPSDDLYRVQEAMFGTWWERGTAFGGDADLSTLVATGTAEGRPWGLWVSEAGRFRVEHGAGEAREVVLYEASDAPAEVWNGEDHAPLDRFDSAVRSWLYRVLLVRPIVRESLNATFEADGSLRMVVRQGIRERIDLVLRIYLNEERTRMERVEAAPLSRSGETGPTTHLLELAYDEDGRFASFTRTFAGQREEVVLGTAARGTAIPLPAFQDPRWPAR